MQSAGVSNPSDPLSVCECSNDLSRCAERRHQHLLRTGAPTRTCSAGLDAEQAGRGCTTCDRRQRLGERLTRWLIATPALEERRDDTDEQ